MERVKRITIDYAPRDAFKAYHAAKQRFCVSVAHRRAGKTVARINKLIKAAVLCKNDAPRFGYLAPYFVQAKEIAWAYLKRYAAPLNPQINESELSIKLPFNGAVIRLYGADNADRLRGLYFDGMVVDEAQDVAPRVLTEIILPALSDRQGWLDISGTPKGWGNLLGVVFKRAQSEPETWFSQLLKASSTGILPESELLQMRSLMPPNEYEQEFECSFDAAIKGAYYAAEMARAQAEGRITSVPYDASLRVNTAWDLGVSDSTSIWFYQQVGREIRVIDYYEKQGEGLPHYAKVLDEKNYLYGKHTAPHDIEVRELGSGKSRIEIARGLGIKFVPLPASSVEDGIAAGRMVLSRCWFDERKCGEGINALKQYREKYDDKRGVGMGPLHDWTSHAADAWRYLAVGLSEVQAKRREQHMEINWMG